MKRKAVAATRLTEQEYSALWRYAKAHDESISGVIYRSLQRLLAEER